MPLRPEDVVRKTFKNSRLRRGYDEDEVDGFLEEVVGELTRLHASVDDLRAAALKPRSVGDVETDRVVREREQLDLIQGERQELVSELGALQSRMDRATVQVAEADERAAAAHRAAAEAEARREESDKAEVALQQQVARAQAVHDDIRQANDRLTAQLRALRVDAETRAAEMLGTVAAVAPAGATPEDDYGVIVSLAGQLHEEHVQTGLAQARSTVAQATAEAQRLVSEAEAEAEALRTDATSFSERVRAEAQAQADELKRAARAESDKLRIDGQGRARPSRRGRPGGARPPPGRGPDEPRLPAQGLSGRAHASARRGAERA